MMVNNSVKTSQRYSKPYFEGFILSVIVCWLPFKPLAYLLPFTFILWFTVRSNSGLTLVKSIAFLLFFAVAIGCYMIFYAIVGEDFILQNAFLFLITYSAFIVIFLLPSRVDLLHPYYTSYIKIIKSVILIQSLLGITQVMLYVIITGGNFDFSTGDIAEGTLNPMSFLHPSLNFNNQIFTNNLILLLLFYVPHAIYYKKGMWICILGFFAVILASVWHMLMPFLLAVALVSIYFSRSFFKLSLQRLLIVFFIVLGSGLAIAIQPSNFSLIQSYYRKMVNSESPKLHATENSLTALPFDFPWVYAIGLGPGQYSSRAGLIGTGKYFGSFEDPKKVPLITPSVSRAFDKYTYPLWLEVATRPAIYGDSTMARPFYSVLSIIVELGFLSFAAFIIVIFRFFQKLKKLYAVALKSKEQLKAFYILACGVVVVYISMISMFENYLEATHAIFLGLLLSKCFYSHARVIN
jgi:hypothetical protein